MTNSLFTHLRRGYLWIIVLATLLLYYAYRLYQNSYTRSFSIEVISFAGIILTIAIFFILSPLLQGHCLEYVKTKVDALLKRPNLYLAIYVLIQYILFAPFTRTSRDVGKLGQTITIMKTRGLAYFFKHYTIMPWLGRQHPPFQALLAYPFPLDEMVTLKLTTVVLSVFTVLATFEIARMYLGSRQAMFSALLLTNIYLFMKMAVDGKIDSLIAFLFTFTILFFLRASQQKEFRDALIAGIFTGLGLLTKYFFVLVFPILLFFSILNRKRSNWSTLGTIFFTSVIVMLPWLIYAYYSGILNTHIEAYGTRVIENVAGLDLFAYIRDSLRSFGLHLLIIAFLGIIQLAKAHQITRQDLFFIVWAFFSLTFFAFMSTKVARFSTFAIPAFAMIITRSLSKLTEEMTEHERYFLFGLVLGVSIIWSALLIAETFWGCCFMWSRIEDDLVLPPMFLYRVITFAWRLTII